MDDDRRSRRPIARPMAATTTAATGRGGRRARARDAALPRLRFIDGEEEDARAARDGADADDRDAREEKKNEVGRGEEEGEETGASGEREAAEGRLVWKPKMTSEPVCARCAYDSASVATPFASNTAAKPFGAASSAVAHMSSVSDLSMTTSAPVWRHASTLWLEPTTPTIGWHPRSLAI